MLESTFQHIPGVGERTERRLWARGCRCWSSLLDDDFNLPADAYIRLKAGAKESISRLEAKDHEYFARCLPRKLAWRAYGAFKDGACYLDIETTGLSPDYAHVTTVCVHSPKRTKTYIYEQNMGELKADLAGYKYIVTFNGARFDLPFLSNNLGLRFPQIHLDLMQPLRTLGYRGGLKAVEKELGLTRGSDGVTGLDAVYLWHAYRSKKPVTVAGRRVAGEDALRMLVDYNRDDTVNLEELARLTVKMLKEKHGKSLKA
ncbi:MAG: ribonuclease H-like domain-containing protein [Candidatus Altiarchaeota archaeon]